MGRPRKENTRDVTEEDFRIPEYRNARPEDYERNSAGDIVRKDRWETMVREIAGLVAVDDIHIEVPGNVVEAVRRLKKSVPSCGQHTFIPPDIVVWNVAVKMTPESLQKLPSITPGTRLIVVVPDEAVVREKVSPLINTSASFPLFAEYERFAFMVAQSIDTVAGAK